MTKKQEAANLKAEHIAKLREWFPKGSTVHCNVESVSLSGMSRVISVHGYFRDEAGKIAFDNNGEPMKCFPNYSVSIALDMPLVRAGGRDGVKIGGCGMDMCFALVYELAYALHGDGYALNHR